MVNPDVTYRAFHADAITRRTHIGPDMVNTQVTDNNVFGTHYVKANASHFTLSAKANNRNIRHIFNVDAGVFGILLSDGAVYPQRQWPGRIFVFNGADHLLAGADGQLDIVLATATCGAAIFAGKTVDGIQIGQVNGAGVRSFGRCFHSGIRFYRRIIAVITAQQQAGAYQHSNKRFIKHGLATLCVGYLASCKAFSTCQDTLLISFDFYWCKAFVISCLPVAENART